MNIPKVDDFRSEIQTLKNEAKEMNEEFIEINARVLHEMLGNHKGKNARMASCCNAMYSCMNPGDLVIQYPNPRIHNTETKGLGSRLTIRYYL